MPSMAMAHNVKPVKFTEKEGMASHYEFKIQYVIQKSIASNVEFIKNLIKESKRNAATLKSIKQRCPKSVRAALKEEGITL